VTWVSDSLEPREEECVAHSARRPVRVPIPSCRLPLPDTRPGLANSFPLEHERQRGLRARLARPGGQTALKPGLLSEGSWATSQVLGLSHYSPASAFSLSSTMRLVGVVCVVVPKKSLEPARAERQSEFPSQTWSAMLVVVTQVSDTVEDCGLL